MYSVYINRNNDVHRGVARSAFKVRHFNIYILSTILSEWEFWWAKYFGCGLSMPTPLKHMLYQSSNYTYSIKLEKLTKETTSPFVSVPFT